MAWLGSVRWGRLLRLVLASMVSVLALTGLVRLSVPATAQGVHEEPPGVARQLAFVRAALEDGAARDAQGLFPEGYFFSYELYGLSWVELGLRGADRATAVREAGWALSHLDSPEGQAPFSPSLVPSYGVFYQGWTTWLRGGILLLQPQPERDPAQVQRFAADAAALATAFDASATPFLQAYPGQAWPVDSTVAVAALRLHDRLLQPRFGGTVSRWRALGADRLDPGTGRMPHRVRADTGEPLEGARGTSQSVIQRFLPEIDQAFARDQYLRFREVFVDWPLGLGPAVREYPSGVDGRGDVDSGPLVFGASLSATVVTLGAAQVQGDNALAAAIGNYGELMGLPIDTPWTKRYALGLLPVGDAFVAWAKTATGWGLPPAPPPPSIVSSWWRLPLIALLIAAGTAPWLPRLVRTLKRRRSAQQQPSTPESAAAPG